MIYSLDQLMETINNNDNLRQVVAANYSLLNDFVDEQFCPCCGLVRKCEVHNITLGNHYKFNVSAQAYFSNSLPFFTKANVFNVTTNRSWLSAKQPNRRN